LLAGRHNSRVAPDHRHDSFVVISKRSSSLACDLRQDIFRSPVAALLGNRTQLWQGQTIGARNVGEVAQYVNTGKTVNGEVRCNVDSPSVPPRQPGICAEG